VFDRDTGGIDVDFEDLPTAQPTTTRLLVDADVGLGALEVQYEDPDHHYGPTGAGNKSCAKPTETIAQA
jgi:hypothetical protein